MIQVYMLCVFAGYRGIRERTNRDAVSPPSHQLSLRHGLHPRLHHLPRTGHDHQGNVSLTLLHYVPRPHRGPDQFKFSVWLYRRQYDPCCLLSALTYSHYTGSINPYLMFRGFFFFPYPRGNCLVTAENNAITRTFNSRQ